MTIGIISTDSITIILIAAIAGVVIPMPATTTYVALSAAATMQPLIPTEDSAAETAV